MHCLSGLSKISVEANTFSLEAEIFMSSYLMINTEQINWQIW